MIFLLSLLTLGIWLYLLLGRGGFWRSTPVLANRAPTGAAKVTVVIPARDEAENIEATLSSLLAQDYQGELAIVLVDDNSTDGTGAIAQRLADNDSRLKIVTGAPLAAGWSGKLWAVNQGLAHPAALAADYILLTDADIAHGVGHVAQLVAKAETGRLDMVSEMVHLHCATPAERALIPAFVFFFQALYPFGWANDPANKLAAAAGGTMLVSRTALTHIEGVKRIRHHLIDDVALSQQVKGVGSTWLGHAEKADSLRIYEGPGEIWRMIARTAYVQLNHSPLMLLGACAALLLTYIAPPVLLCLGGWASVVGFITWALMAYVFQPTLRRYRQSPWWGLAMPPIALFYLAATIASAVQHYQGQGGNWKNRVYPEASA